MSVPFMLDPPPVVSQTAQTYWAAAYESWDRANGNESCRSSQQMIELLRGILQAGYLAGRQPVCGRGDEPGPGRLTP